MDSRQIMRLALREARKASGRTYPNPPVGAVLFRDEELLARGHTRPVGDIHAEIAALEGCVRRHGADTARGATMAVTLEPCAHTGRTGPCCEALIAAGIARVIVGHRDPNPEVAGRGIDQLRTAGIEVEVGVLEAECRAQHRGFLSVQERGRPFLALKLASSLDGRIATRTGASRWITGEASRGEVHRMRGRSDAVLIGSGTARADDPSLTARRGERITHRPVRVLIDAGLQTPASLGMFQSAHEHATWVLCCDDADTQRANALETLGVRMIQLPRGDAGHIDLAAGMAQLAKEGLTEILVEGGGQLAAELLRRGLIDEVTWFLAPILLGGDGRPALGELGVEAMAEALRLVDPRVRRFGPDLCLKGPVAVRGDSQ